MTNDYSTTLLFHLVFNIAITNCKIHLFNKQVDKRLRPLELSLENYQHVVALMDENMNQGLSEKSDISADLKMYITYVRSLPDRSGM